jgi:hypothetical protein
VRRPASVGRWQRLSAHGCPVAIADVDERGLKETEASISDPTLPSP